MKYNDSVLKSEEKIVFVLRELYRSYGYRQYKMSKFEEYDLYARNKDFLVSDNIITFTDTNGRLMALKPDVTLSIVRSCREEDPAEVRKVFYDENVYRVSRGSLGYKEIMQAGLEYIGNIDDYAISEVLYLAARSLQAVSDHYLLNISHLGIVSDALDRLELPAEERRRALALIGEKNPHELRTLCLKSGRSPEAAELLLELLDAGGPPETVLEKLSSAGCDPAKVEQLRKLTDMLEATEAGGHLVLDFSIVNDMSYYNGIVFRGYIEGVPSGVLAGGQYDQLVQKMIRKPGAIGFALYLDFLERFHEQEDAYDVDVALLYGPETDTGILFRAVRQLCSEGFRVTAVRSIPDKLRCERIMKIGPEGVLETC